ncbi:hypothetical protein ACGFXC_31435 [Streptomyces sp. NPDC048507]|uniref:hypothetical protein n=1 Tax=Streptomyces sp. NPDC048507 TaxID=3365560 RepID=UPI00371928A4
MFAGRGRSRVRFGAVLVGVVLALTGFSTGGGSSGKGDGGGHGCSSSKSSKSSGSSKTSGGSGGAGSSTRGTGGGTATASPTATPRAATARVTSCGDASRPSATVEVTSLLDRKATFLVSLSRRAAGGALIETATGTVTLDARATGTAAVAMAEPARAGEVADCRLDGVREAPGTASPDSGDRTPGPTPKPTLKPAPKDPKATRPGPKATRPRR